MKLNFLKFAVIALIVCGAAFAQQPVSVANVPHVIVNTAPTTAVTESGTWNVNATLAAETTKVIGTVNVAAAQTIGVTGTFWQATQPVSGTFWQATQPVSGTFWQATQPVSGSVTATQATGSNLHVVVDTAPSTAVTGTFWQATQPVSGTFWQATQPVSVADAANVTLGAKADAKSTATDTTSITAMQVLKEISAMEQAPASRAVTNSGTFAVQAAQSGTWTVQPGNTANTTAWKVDGSAVTQPVSGTFWQATQPVSGTFWQATQPVSVADAGDVTLGAKADAKSTATDTTAITAMQVLKEISAMEQAPASRAVTNAGTFAVQATLAAETTKVIGTVNVAASQTIATTNTGTFAVQAAQSGTWTVQPGNTANTTAWKVDGSAVTQPVSGTFWQASQPVTPGTTATTTNASLRCTLVSAASTNATNCKGSAGNVYGFRFVNTTATLYYLRMYNSSSSPTCSSSTGFVETIPIPASATGAGIVAIEPMGEAYSTGISFCFTGGSSSTDNTNAATGVFGTILYQ